MNDTAALIHRYYEAFNAQDWEGMLGCLAEDVLHDLNQGGRETGVAAFRDFLRRMDRCYLERLEDVVIMTSADGRRAAAEYRVHGVYRATDEGLPEAWGQTYVLTGGAFFDVADGLIRRVSNYYNLKAWLLQVTG